MDGWFSRKEKVDVSQLGRQYVVTDYAVKRDSTLVQTDAIQRVINHAAEEGGGVIVIPEGTFLTGALFFKQGTHLHVVGTLKGSDRIADFPLQLTRIEGETCQYFAALVNAYGLDGFTITLLAGILDSPQVEPAVYEQGRAASETDVCRQLEACDDTGCATGEQSLLDEPRL